MAIEYLKIEQSPSLEGTVDILGAKNAVLVIMASLLLTRGISYLYNVPNSADVLLMVELLEGLGAVITFDKEEHLLIVDTRSVQGWEVPYEIMSRMRASILVMGPLLVTGGRAAVGLPGGCSIGSRPIDYHLKNFEKMGAVFKQEGSSLYIQAEKIYGQRIVLDYPSVGATENILMAAVKAVGKTTVINAALEPEVLDLIRVLCKMGASITIPFHATIEIQGVDTLIPVSHIVIPDRLEAGAFLLAGAITGGDIFLPSIPLNFLDVFILKVQEMGHLVTFGSNEVGIRVQGAKKTKAVSFKTGPFPNFPTDLQSPFMALQLLASGTSVIEETVFENRFMHVEQMLKMGANLKQLTNSKVMVTGVNYLQGAAVEATDIRASCALMLAGLVAQGTTIMTGLHHWKRGYDSLEKRLSSLGARVELVQLDFSLSNVDVGKQDQLVL